MEEPAPVMEGGGKLKDGKSKDALVRDFGSVEGFNNRFSAVTVGVKGKRLAHSGVISPRRSSRLSRP